MNGMTTQTRNKSRKHPWATVTAPQLPYRALLALISVSPVVGCAVCVEGEGVRFLQGVSQSGSVFHVVVCPVVI